MSISLQMLEVFQSVAKHRSFSSAARESFLSQSHVSGQIRKLEEHLQVRLFRRSNPQISLTEAGIELLVHASRILEQSSTMETAMSSYARLDKGVVRVGAVDSAGNFLLPPVLAEFRKRWPKISVEVRIGNTAHVQRWLTNGEIEVAICPQAKEEDGYVSRRCFREELVLIRPADWGGREPAHLADIVHLPLVVREEGSYTLDVLRKVLAAEQAEGHFVAQLTGNTAVAEAVSAGVGFALIARSSARPWLAADSVRICSPQGLSLANDFHLLHRSGARVNAATRTFLAAFPTGQLRPVSMTGSARYERSPDALPEGPSAGTVFSGATSSA